MQITGVCKPTMGLDHDLLPLNRNKPGILHYMQDPLMVV